MAVSSGAARRGVNPLSLAFLDVMFCGFGAVILIFLILDHASTTSRSSVSRTLTAEIALLEEEVREGEEGLVRTRNAVSDVDFRMVQTQGMADRIQERIDDFLQELAALENASVASEDDIARLRADVESLERELMRLHASALDRQGASVRQFLGEGQRQYLSGLYLGGQRIAIMVDTSASMLDDTLVNIIRTRNRGEAHRREAPKWRRAVKIVDWISAQLPLTSRYQLYGFGERVTPALAGTKGEWLEVADRDRLEEAVRAVLRTTPDGGTDFGRMFASLAELSPPPDNVFLITDGLPTADAGGAEGLVTPRDRMALYEDAVEELPEGIPVNVILMPLEGDPSAAAAFWQLAQSTYGAFLSPSADWPGGESAVERGEEAPRDDVTAARVETTEEVTEDLGVSFPADI